jgi:hypothetical protein
MRVVVPDLFCCLLVACEDEEWLRGQPAAADERFAAVR